jgi:GNAT superfamily N-acetyltransferase
MTTEIAIVDRLAPFTEGFIDEMIALARRVFAEVSPARVAWRMTNMPDLSCFVALAGGAAAGFKIGYAMSEDRYYSWLGGVDPAYRRRGIAAQLMDRQHEWARSRGYRTIETRSDHDNVAMAQVNLASGFVVCGVHSQPGRTQILFAKTLSASG